MNNRRSRSLLVALLMIAVLAIGVFAFTGCGNKECEIHDFEINPVTATCDTSGLVDRYCYICGYFDQVESEPLGHRYNEWRVEEEPTCSTDGRNSRYCEVCGDRDDEYKPKTGHKIESWNVGIIPKLDETGNVWAHCKDCYAYVSFDLPKLDDQSYAVEVVDSQTKKYTVTLEGTKVEIIDSKYNFFTVLGEHSEVIGYEIGGHDITADTLTLPTTYDGKPVLGISSQGFRYSSIRELIVPEGYKYIGKYIFMNCESYPESITLPSTIEEIGEKGINGGWAFDITNVYYNGTVEDWCSITFNREICFDNIYFKSANGYSALTEIIIPDTVTEIGKYQFLGFKTVETVTIPASVTSIADSAFYDCTSLLTVYYMNNANRFDTIGGNDALEDTNAVTNAAVYYYSATAPINAGSNTYFYLDENGDVKFWVKGNTVSGNKYVYSYTETNVSDEYWMMLQAAKDAGMLEYIFSGELFAEEQIEMVMTSNTKAEYEAKLIEFSATAGQGSYYQFDANGKVTVSMNGQIQATADYVEYDNVIYLTNGTVVCYVDPDNSRIYEYTATEYNVVWKYFTLVTD